MQVAQRNLEIAYHDTGYYDRRVAQLRERLRSAPDDRDARWELGRAYAILGSHELATAEFEQLLAHRADDVAAIIQLGLAEKNRGRSEEHTSELQSRLHLVCRLLLEKKKKNKKQTRCALSDVTVRGAARVD